MGVEGGHSQSGCVMCGTQQKLPFWPVLSLLSASGKCREVEAAHIVAECCLRPRQVLHVGKGLHHLVWRNDPVWQQLQQTMTREGRPTHIGRQKRDPATRHGRLKQKTH